MANRRRRVAFITGVTGQDGAHLAAYLIDHGWRVYGGFRRGSSNKIWRLQDLGVETAVELVECQLNEPQHMIEILKSIQPDHIYSLAGESFIDDSFKYPSVAIQVNTIGTINLLNAARLVCPQARLFFASSAEIFGTNAQSYVCDESTPLQPSNPYAISKTAALHFVRLYRQCYNLFACSGILFNHEGRLRGRQFVTRKITFNIARLKLQGGPPIQLGNMSAQRDWGAATDYVKAMYSMLNHSEPIDMIIASGRLTSVRDFLTMAAQAVGFDPIFEGKGLDEVCKDRSSGLLIAEVSDNFFRRHDTSKRSGDPSLITSQTGWARSIGLKELINEMVGADINRWKEGNINV